MTAPTPDTSLGDEPDEMLIVLASGISEPFDPKTIYGDHYQEWLDRNRNNPRVKESKDRLNRLMLTRERELLEKLKDKQDLCYDCVHDTSDDDGSDTMPFIPLSAVDEAVAAIDAQLNKEETDGDVPTHSEPLKF